MSDLSPPGGGNLKCHRLRRVEQLTRQVLTGAKCTATYRPRGAECRPSACLMALIVVLADALACVPSSLPSSYLFQWNKA